MNEDLKSLYIMVLKYNWQVSHISILASGEAHVFLKAPTGRYPLSAPQLKETWMGEHFLILRPRNG